MNRIDDDVIAEFSDVVTRVRSEFDQVQAPVRTIAKRKVVGRVLIAASVAAAIAIVPTLNTAPNAAAAWAATPTVLSSSQLQEIKAVCTKLGEPADYQIAITDERMERGFMILKADRGANYTPALRRYATIMCKYERKNGAFTSPSIFLAETPGLGNATSWGEEELGDLKVWIYLSAVGPETSRVEITTAQGLVFDASLANGYTSAWWPRLPEAGSEATATTNAFVRYYDANGKLIKTFSLLNGKTTTP